MQELESYAWCDLSVSLIDSSVTDNGMVWLAEIYTEETNIEPHEKDKHEPDIHLC